MNTKNIITTLDKMKNHVSTIIDSPRIDIIENGNKKKLVYKWSGMEGWFFVLLMGVIYFSIIRKPSDFSPFSILVFCAFAFFFLSIAINRTYFEFTATAFSWKHRPLPLRASGTVLLKDIQSVYYEEMRAKRGRYVYNIRIILDDGKNFTVLHSIDNLNIAKKIVSYIKREL